MYKIILITSRSITIELTNKLPYCCQKEYDIFINEELKLKTNKNVNSIFSLEPNTKYKVKISNVETEFTTLNELVSLNIKKFNAVGDGINDDTIAIQTAIFSCPDNGCVYIPKGTYYTKPLFIRSNITIYLEKDAVLLGNTNRLEYPILPGMTLINDETDDFNLGSWEGNPLDIFASLITGINVSNVNIIGEGKIDANADKSDWWVNPKVRNIAFRPRGVFLNRCDNITLQGITICNTPSWNIHPYFSTNLKFIDLKVINPAKSPNTDGCDPESCKNVDIIGVDFSVGDDCIAIKSGKIYMGRKYKTPSENFNIRNCVMKYGHGGVVFGSEMGAGIKDINVTQCYFKDTERGLRIKTRRGRGKDAVIDGIKFENIYMDGVLAPLIINMFYHCDPDGHTDYVCSKDALPVDDLTPYIGKFHFKNITCDNCEVIAGAFYGLPEQPIKEINIENMTFIFKDNCRKMRPASMDNLEETSKEGLYFSNVETVILKDVTVLKNEGEKAVFINVKERKGKIK